MAKRQLEVPGTERETVPEIEAIAQPYVTALYKRMSFQKKEIELKSQLLEVMTQLQVATYVVYDKDDNGYLVRRNDGKPGIEVERLDKPKKKEGEE